MMKGDRVKIEVRTQGQPPNVRSYVFGTVAAYPEPHQIIVNHDDDTVRAYEPHRVEKA